MIWIFVIRIYFFDLKEISNRYSTLFNNKVDLIWFIVLNATFGNISVISWRSVLLKKTRGPRENHRHVASNWQSLSHNVVLLALSGSRTHNLPDIQDNLQNELQDLITCMVVIGTDCIGSCKSNHHMITATTAPYLIGN